MVVNTVRKEKSLLYGEREKEIMRNNQTKKVNVNNGEGKSVTKRAIVCTPYKRKGK